MPSELVDGSVPLIWRRILGCESSQLSGSRRTAATGWPRVGLELLRQIGDFTQNSEGACPQWSLRKLLLPVRCGSFLLSPSADTASPKHLPLPKGHLPQPPAQGASAHADSIKGCSKGCLCPLLSSHPVMNAQINSKLEKE